MLYTAEQLRQLAVGPREQVAMALATEPDDRCHELIRSTVRAHRRFIAGFSRWGELVVKFVLDTQGGDMSEELAATAPIETAARANRLGNQTPRRDRCAEALVLDAVVSGNRTQALRRYDRLRDDLRRQHGTGRDWVTMLLSTVYRRLGVDALEAVLRRSAEETLLAWMPEDISRDPRERLTSWTRMLHGNFARLRIAEHDRKFVISQTPCGTCARQVAAGRYRPPLDLAIVSGAHRVTLGRSDTPVYRAHVAAFHYLVPLERIGVPWPVVDCPVGLAQGLCRISLYKDPLDPAALDEQAVLDLRSVSTDPT